MENGEVRESVDEAVECRGGELKAVEIDSSNGKGGVIVRRVVTEEAFVVTDIRADPCLCDAKWVGSDEGFEGLNYGVHHGQSLV